MFGRNKSKKRLQTCHCGVPSHCGESHIFFSFSLFISRTFGFLDLLEVPYYFFLVIFKRRVFNGFMRTIQALVIITLLSLLPTSLSLLLP
ncbi:hypothetical protein J3E72DRAFT_291317 [Bipolaris maydis]|uniref:uncharacterized protein n=1 Tax=Cochliobolus heterostrophus TaxID=5016 RepID=UPI0024D80E85|nr:hypothetical protein J3E73DRAFT_269702 [Bipolaris maydis]KAJ5060172.1 hypothetical protein J3E74DRAFT_342456 [Bipolaris maydis]KAJ6202034.1 hypothetical protein J3E72DRAFT_291317 [Bipolaris maydis]KAJ6273367.1 hypothetical protein PSV08DRAFT_273725 [Bipolaris maydis]KAJ6284580.1 hypothetical protein J3E71DRAFT_266042 [Bipolaris maydis]